MNKLIERFIKYVKVETKSDDLSETTPSAFNVFALSEILEKDLKEIGCSDVFYDRKTACVYAKISASAGYETAPVIGFIAHMDTSPDFSGENVNPIFTENYDGNDLPLGTSGRILSVKDFPHLKKLKGRTLITTDGTTLLGADDKAGVAEIVEMAERIISDKIPHGGISICFTPDEEVGKGTDNFDLERFGADFGYTLDGDEEGSLSFENFNAAAAHITIEGVNVHPGSAKDIMINASLVAMEINSLLPAGEIPADTEGYEGFFHLTDMCGCVEKAELRYIIRDHDKKKFEERKNLCAAVVDEINGRYGKAVAKIEIKDQYYNMREYIEPEMHLVDNAIAAARELGLDPVAQPMRGGTDGAMLTYKGLPCPNLGTGGYGFHGPFEHITVEGMELETQLIIKLVEKYAKMIRKG